MERKYSSDLSNKEWEIILKVLYKREGMQGRPPPKDARRLWGAIFYVTKNGCFWQDLPRDFSPWKRVYNYFNRLKHRGIIAEIMDLACDSVRIKKSRKVSPGIGIIDSQSVKTRSFKK